MSLWCVGYGGGTCCGEALFVRSFVRYLSGHVPLNTQPASQPAQPSQPGEPGLDGDLVVGSIVLINKKSSSWLVA